MASAQVAYSMHPGCGFPLSPRPAPPDNLTTRIAYHLRSYGLPEGCKYTCQMRCDGQQSYQLRMLTDPEWILNALQYGAQMQVQLLGNQAHQVWLSWRHLQEATQCCLFEQYTGQSMFSLPLDFLCTRADWNEQLLYSLTRR